MKSRQHNHSVLMISTDQYVCWAFSRQTSFPIALNLLTPNAPRWLRDPEPFSNLDQQVLNVRN